MSEKRICPECGADLDAKGESAKAHALSHWPEALPNIPEYKEAIRRQAILYAMHERDVRAAATKEG